MFESIRTNRIIHIEHIHISDNLTNWTLLYDAFYVVVSISITSNAFNLSWDGSEKNIGMSEIKTFTSRNAPISEMKEVAKFWCASKCRVSINTR